MKHLFAIVLITLFFSCTKRGKIEQPETTDSNSLSYTILNTLPHDRAAFTEGLEFYNNKVLESTGQHGNSWIAEIDVVSGRNERKVILPENYFGEGITVLHNRIYHLTYTTRVGFIYNATTYQKLGQFDYDARIKEGWGLTHNQSNLILSDGTDRIHFLDTISFKVVKSISVKEGDTPIKQINELEFLHGHIFANVWETNLILKIDAETGRVVGKVDLSVVVNKIKTMYPQANELNGIAYDEKSDAFLITGKNWPECFMVRINSL